MTADTAFFTIDDLQDQLQVDAIDPNVFTRVLNSATAKVQGLVGHPIFLTTDDEAKVPAGGLRVLQLPHWPVVSIGSVTLDSVVLDAACYQASRVGQLTFVHHRYHHSIRRCNHWGFGLVDVVYTHGYSSIPGPIREVALDLAVGAYSNPQNLRGETLGNYSYNYSTGSGQTVTDYHQQLLDPYR